jgi:hypothetical protein
MVSARGAFHRRADYPAVLNALRRQWFRHINTLPLCATIESAQRLTASMHGELTEAEKDKNREISRERVEIEHQIGGIKRCKIVTDMFRNRKDYYGDDVFETAFGLHNFRLHHRQLAAA